MIDINDLPKTVEQMTCSSEEFGNARLLLERPGEYNFLHGNSKRIASIARQLATEFDITLGQSGSTENLLKAMEESDNLNVTGLAAHVRQKLAELTPAHNVTSKDHEKLAYFILFSQHEFMLNLSHELNRENISIDKFFLLNYMTVYEELTMTDIARKMGVKTASATGFVDRLEKQEYVERKEAIDDRRKVMVKITDKGTKLVSRLRDELMSQIADAMNESGASNVSAFISHPEDEKKSK